MEIRCSKLARYMVCAGFAHLDVEDLEAGEPAREGTAAGEYLQYLLEDRPLGKVATNGVYFTDDMKFHTTPIYQDMKSRAVDKILCETRIDWQTRSGIWIRGQYDSVFVDKRGYLCIEDLKFGWGIVEVKNNWQLIGYAIGEVIRRGQSFTHISFKIHQPRPHHEDGHTREWLVTYAELLALKEKIEVRMDELANGRKDFQTGDQCKYCKGAAEACPAFSKAFYRSIDLSHEFVQDSLTNEEVAQQLDLVKRAGEVIKIKLDSLTQLGSDRIKKGGLIPGYIQANQYSQRAWKPNVSSESIKLMTGIDVVETSFMSPAKVEKMGVSKALVKQLSGKVLTGVKLEKKNGSDVGNKIFGNSNPTGGN